VVDGKCRQPSWLYEFLLARHLCAEQQAAIILGAERGRKIFRRLDDYCGRADGCCLRKTGSSLNDLA
jgi:hypothetical protein